MIIFGISSRTRRLAVVSLACRACGHTAAHPLWQRVRRFSLFFVPLFRIGRPKYGMQCTYCGTQTDLTEEEAERTRQQGAARA